MWSVVATETVQCLALRPVFIATLWLASRGNWEDHTPGSMKYIVWKPETGQQGGTPERHGGTWRDTEEYGETRRNTQAWGTRTGLEVESKAGICSHPLWAPGWCPAALWCLHRVSKGHLGLKQEAVTLREHCLPWVFGGKEPRGRTWSFRLRQVNGALWMGF